MKKTLITVINVYQIFVSIFLKSLLGTTKSCRFDENCSSYAKRMISEQGALRGVYLGILRLSKCQPFYKGNIYGNI